MDSLTEYNSNDGRASKNKITSFAPKKYDWGWIAFKNSTFQGLVADQIQYSSTLEVGAGNEKSNVHFNLSTVLFSESGTISVTEFDTKDVYQNTLKWTTMISMWPFLSSSNTLELCISLMTNSNDISTTVNVSDHKNMFHFTFDNFSFDIPLVAECGQNRSNVSAKMNGNGNNLQICLTFEACVNNTLTHDPFVQSCDSNPNHVCDVDPGPTSTLDSSGDTSESNVGDRNLNDSDIEIALFISLAVIGLIVIALFVIIIIYYTKKRRILKRETDTDTLEALLIVFSDGSGNDAFSSTISTL